MLVRRQHRRLGCRQPRCRCSGVRSPRYEPVPTAYSPPRAGAIRILQLGEDVRITHGEQRFRRRSRAYYIDFSLEATDARWSRNASTRPWACSAVVRLLAALPERGGSPIARRRLASPSPARFPLAPWAGALSR